MSTSVRLIPIPSLDDPRVEPYRHLKDRDVAALGGPSAGGSAVGGPAAGGLFIAEGEHVVRRLLASGVETDSVLLAERRAEEIAPLVPAGVPVYVVPQERMNAIVGYKFHSGVLACGRRPAPPSVEKLLASLPRRALLVICPELANAENLGGLIRLSAGFGADALVLGERSADPFFRRSVRVSMGTVFRLPIVRSPDIRADLRRLRDAGVELIATVLDADAEPLSAASRPDRLGLLFGNEAQGLDRDVVGLCQRRVTIPMKLGTDSLNVAVAAGIFLYHFTAERGSVASR